MYLDMETLYYSKRHKGNEREYYKTLDKLYTAEKRFELIGRHIIASWVGILNQTVTVLEN